MAHFRRFIPKLHLCPNPNFSRKSLENQIFNFIEPKISHLLKQRQFQFVLLYYGVVYIIAFSLDVIGHSLILCSGLSAENEIQMSTCGYTLSKINFVKLKNQFLLMLKSFISIILERKNYLQLCAKIGRQWS